MLIRAHGQAGLSEWIVETRARIFNTLPVASPRVEDYEASEYDTLGELEVEVKHEIDSEVKREDSIGDFGEPESETTQGNSCDDEETKVME